MQILKDKAKEQFRVGRAGSGKWQRYLNGKGQRCAAEDSDGEGSGEPMARDSDAGGVEEA